MLSKKKARYVIEQIINLYPNAQPTLNFKNHYELIVAVALSAQTTDLAVNQVTPALFEKFPSPAELAQATPAEIEPYISRLGLYRNKAKNLHRLGQQLTDEFGGQVPNQREELMKLAGVGRKTANVVLSLGFGIPAFAVDTHVERVCKHHHICKQSATPFEVEKRVMEILPAHLWIKAHQAMIYFGREVCHPRHPRCEEFPQLYHFPEDL